MHAMTFSGCILLITKQTLVTQIKMVRTRYTAGQLPIPDGGTLVFFKSVVFWNALCSFSYQMVLICCISFRHGQGTCGPRLWTTRKAYAKV